MKTEQAQNLMPSPMLQNWKKLWANDKSAFSVLAVLYLISGFMIPAWWSFLIAATAAGFLLAPRKNQSLFVGTLAALMWVMVAFIEDAATGWRISSRLAGVASIPTGVLLYLFLGLIAGALAWSACAIAFKIRKLLEAGFPQ